METANNAEGLVLWSGGNKAYVLVGPDERLLPLPGRWRKGSTGIKPVAAGDRVSLVKAGGEWRIKDLLPRHNEFTRREPGPKPYPQTVAANLERVLVIASIAEPATPFGLVDRLITTAITGGVACDLVVNKIDIADANDLKRWNDNYGRTFDLFLTSAETGAGMKELSRQIAGGVILFMGSSGVGKSSLVNRLYPGLNLKVKRVSSATGKGVHTTSVAQLHRLPSGLFIGDTPGLRECGLWGVTPALLLQAFPEMVALAEDCRFRNCRHAGDTGCAVKPLSGTDRLPEARYQSYLKLLLETV